MKHALIAVVLLVIASGAQTGGFDLSPQTSNLYLLGIALCCAGLVGMLTRASR